MIEVKNVSKKFDKLIAVDNLSFNLNKGEILGLLGANGAGKTTTFRMMLNVMQPTSGKILFNGKEVSYDNSSEIGFLSEERALNGKYTVDRQLKLFGQLKGMNVTDLNVAIDYWLDFFNLTDKKNKKVKELSKGNQQKIQFISAIIHKPKLLILDEPFTGLDPYNVQLFQKIILDLKNQGTAIIFSSHRLDQIEKFCDNIIVLVEGKDYLRGKISELKRNSHFTKVVISSTIDIEEIRKLDFVSDVSANGEYLNIYLTNIDAVDLLFDEVKKSKCTHFELVLPTLEDIFLEKVGSRYES